jgi:two-component system cell cycle response regulator DivK
MARILIIEDNPWNIQIAELLLLRAGHEVLQATDAPQGIALARSALPQLILMDLNLPGMDGLAATRLLKQDAATRAIKIHAYTPFFSELDDPAEYVKISAAGCDGIIPKNASQADFLAAIAKALA